MAKEKSYRLSPKKLIKMLEKFHKDPEFVKAAEMAFKYHTGQI